jgi:hypothetical protein
VKRPRYCCAALPTRIYSGEVLVSDTLKQMKNRSSDRALHASLESISIKDLGSTVQPCSLSDVRQYSGCTGCTVIANV